MITGSLKLFSLPVFILLSQILSGCSNINYFVQGASGHLTLMSKREPISQLLKSDTLSKERREQITEVKSIRKFAYEKLKLPKNGSYTSFVELDRDAVTWNIVATKKYSIDPIQTCFPISGCVSYLVYFNKARAEREAEKHKKLGHDVHIIPSPAYSTLGVFDDPIVSTMFTGSISSTAEVVFHELGHQRLFRKNNSAFNEAFASAIGEEGTRLWLRENHPNSLKTYNDHVKKRWQFFNLLLQTSEELRAFYKIKQSGKKQEVGKKQIFNQLKQRYTNLKKEWNGDKRFDRWFTKHPLNNAKLAVIGVYYKLVPEFSKRLKTMNDDFEAFYSYYQNKKDMVKSKKP
ncbi:MAG: putative aminopeptidase [Cocleimonas sp.]|jgi:predicted aminopeptidase